MFTYCENNPVNYSDPSGNYYRSYHEQIDALYFEGFGGGIRGSNGSAGSWGTDANIVAQDRLAISSGRIRSNYDKAKQYTEITNSYMIKSSLVMREYVESIRDGKVSGSTDGVIFEWKIHNLAYRFGSSLIGTGLPVVSNIGNWFNAKGAHVGFGSTIYDDDHSVFSLGMWIAYWCIEPRHAINDLRIEWCE